MKKVSKYSKIREEIKRLAEGQSDLKKCRKTINCPFSTKEEAEIRAKYGNHDQNRWELRHLHLAYQVLKGKEPVYPTKLNYTYYPYSQQKVDDYVAKFKVEVEEKEVA